MSEIKKEKNSKNVKKKIDIDEMQWDRLNCDRKSECALRMDIGWGKDPIGGHQHPKDRKGTDLVRLGLETCLR